jgi:hypothetical protein
MKNRVRRFDIFTIFNYLKNSSSMPANQAKGEAIWLAKLVANKKLYGGSTKTKADSPVKNNKTGEIQYWKTLSGIPQTDVEYDKAIIDRFEDYDGMVKAIKLALSKGLKYEEIRDCEHSHGRFNTGWCNKCSEDFVNNFKNKIA